jgi:hypothetical protein
VDAEVHGYTSTIEHSDVVSIVRTWSEYCEYDMSMIHIFNSAKVVVISASSGVLTRPVRLQIDTPEFVKEGPYIDTMCVYHSDTIKYLQRELPRHDEECDQMASSSSMMIPFFSFAMEPRIGLGVAMLRQALCTMPT